MHFGKFIGATEGLAGGSPGEVGENGSAHFFIRPQQHAEMYVRTAESHWNSETDHQIVTQVSLLTDDIRPITTVASMGAAISSRSAAEVCDSRRKAIFKAIERRRSQRVAAPFGREARRSRDHTLVSSAMAREALAASIGLDARTLSHARRPHSPSATACGRMVMEQAGADSIAALRTRGFDARTQGQIRSDQSTDCRDSSRGPPATAVDHRRVGATFRPAVRAPGSTCQPRSR